MHAGAVIVPAVLAASPKQERLAGLSALRGIAVGVETICRLSLVVPKAGAQGWLPSHRRVRRDGGRCRRRRRSQARPRASLPNALGIAGSMAAGIIEYLADGSWTKRMHAGLGRAIGAARRAAGARRLPRPRARVFEGVHGLFNGFARTREGNCGGAASRASASSWHAASLAFKPYPCGTMIQPYVDCARRLQSAWSSPPDEHRRDCLRGR